jgi:uncharacterized protein YutE (UPF0331/DUF86 family)/predicted nucleotidyltransferase
VDRILDIGALGATVAPFDIGLVVLFGSRAQERARPQSDVDLGVLHRSGRRLGHREIGALQVALSGWAQGQADVVDLSTGDAVFRFEVAAHGRPLFEAEPGAWTAFVARVLIDHDDIVRFIEPCIAAVGDAARRGRAVVSPAVVARKVPEIRARGARVGELLPPTVQDFVAHRTEAEALILNLFLALQESSDLAMHVVADRALGVPGDARGAFDTLAKAGLVPAALAGRLAAAVGLRNRIAHEYGHLDLGLVYEAARDDRGDLDEFAAAVAEVYHL